MGERNQPVHAVDVDPADPVDQSRIPFRLRIPQQVSSDAEDEEDQEENQENEATDCVWLAEVELPSSVL